jgi:hypothetical protein
MPKKGSGYTSIAVTDQVFNTYKSTFEAKKPKLVKKGITSFSGYITSLLEELMERDSIFARFAPYMEEFDFDDSGGTVYIRDNRGTKRIAGVSIQGNELHCDVDDANDCVHVGFAYSIPKVYEVMHNERGMKPPIMKGEQQEEKGASTVAAKEEVPPPKQTSGSRRHEASA